MAVSFHFAPSAPDRDEAPDLELSRRLTSLLHRRLPPEFAKSVSRSTRHPASCRSLCITPEVVRAFWPLLLVYQPSPVQPTLKLPSVMLSKTLLRAAAPLNFAVRATFRHTHQPLTQRSRRSHLDITGDFPPFEVEPILALSGTPAGQ